MSIVTVHGLDFVTTTVAISSGTKNDHSSVIKLVRAYQGDLEEFGGVRFEIQPFETAGGIQQREIAQLNEQQATLILAYMRNSEIVRGFKKALVKEFWEMRNAKNGAAFDPMAALSDPATMRNLLLGYTEKVMALECKVDELAPKAIALDRIAAADGSLCFTDTAKTLQVRLKDLIAWLSGHKWIYRRQGSSWIGYQDKIQAGLVEHKTNTIDRSDGTDKVVTQARITTMGLTKLSEMFGKNNGPISA